MAFSQADRHAPPRASRPITEYTRFAVTREINDGMLEPRFAPKQTAWVLSGNLAAVDPPVAASAPQDADNR